MFVKPRLDAIRAGNMGLVVTMEANRWLREFRTALHARISSHIPNQGGRKHAPEYAKYHLSTYGNDWRYLND
mgnify:CR=1 FL=1